MAIYTARGGQQIAASGTETMLVITAPSTGIVRLRRVEVSQKTHKTSETLFLEVIDATAAGSGGSAVTPNPKGPNTNAAADSTVSSGPTTEPTYPGTVADGYHLARAWNAAIGYEKVWREGEEPIIAPSGIVGFRWTSISGNTTLNAADVMCVVEFEELG